MTITVSDAAAAALLADLAGLMNAGSSAPTISVYTASKPAKPDTAITTQTLLGTLTCSDPVGSVSGRTLTFSSITQDSSADASGNAAWARIKDSNGLAVIDVDAGVIGSSAFLQMNTTNIAIGGPITCTSLIISM